MPLLTSLSFIPRLTIANVGAFSRMSFAEQPEDLKMVFFTHADRKGNLSYFKDNVCYIMSGDLSRSCICLNETRTSFKLPSN